ncbi:hypothetical protein DYE50_02665 [Treponema ruminis]|uniref:Putative transposase/invertase (TIGR01784 family) n=1 Tax=Treponema ruminis TaxID=744515 RepID=A0A7W8LMY7_9SPIR|nr:PD-(D/E)XK nuclease family transposase [Treponema ruminis]MBB5227056.1 putative transposase/invertase (TIGR01784 family) [Treponema ruminis]QSI01482.1 hypothetical protein DYE50_02665 [Treponema ruminis]
MKNTNTLRPSPTALLDPKCDSSFKAMFAADTEDSNKALKDFISTILNRNVVDLELMPNEPASEVKDQNQMSFDVSVKFDDGERIDLEMQSRSQDYDYSARAEIQAARLLSSSNRKGDNWKTPPAYQISVLNFHFNNDDFSPLEWYTMKRSDGKELAGKLNVIFFDLIKIHKLFGKPPEKLTKLEKWGLFLSYASDENKKDYIESIIKSEEGLMRAKSSLLTVSQDEINWAIENSIHTAICDYNTAILNAEEEGERKNAIASAKNLLIETDLSPEKIAKCCSLPLEQVLALKDELKAENR